MPVFISKARRLLLTSPKHIVQFDNNNFKTEDADVIGFLEKHPLVGVEFFEASKAPKPKPEPKQFDMSKVFRYGELKGMLFRADGTPKPNLTDKESLMDEFEKLKEEIGEI